jgi:hypothetical protein
MKLINPHKLIMINNFNFKLFKTKFNIKKQNSKQN